MSFGFVISRHVNNKLSNFYWKECYTCIRKFYDNPILIVDDSSNKEFLTENIVLTNCTVIYDTANKGAGELLPYYYFHKLKPFETAVIIHDNVFLQAKIDFTNVNGLQDTSQAKPANIHDGLCPPQDPLQAKPANIHDGLCPPQDPIRFLWTFTKIYDVDVIHHIRDLCGSLTDSAELLSLFDKKDKWTGCYGVMSVIQWNFLNKIDIRHNFFENMLKQKWHRNLRSGLERVLGLVAYCNEPSIKNSIFGDIHAYIKWGTTFIEYVTQDHRKYPIVKVWASR